MKDFVALISSLFVLLSTASLLHAKLFDFKEPDPNDDLDTLQMIKRAGYPAEAHGVETKDGYLLTIHRIPGQQGSPVVLLQHGVLGSSADWVILGKGKSLAYLLADQGYDVWLGNFRGNTYSRGHTSLSTSDSKYWDFSWHESGVYDLPAMITYIALLKGTFLRAYVGYSMGTTCYYVMASEQPLIAKLVRSMYSLAPVAFMKHVKSPLRYIAPFAHDYKIISSMIGEDEFLPQNYIVKLLAKYGCYLEFWEERLCTNWLFVIVGFDKAQFNYSLLPVILNHTPAGTSAKTMIHYGQEIESGYFRQYDYGERKNLQMYNQSSPPNYNLSKIVTPITLFCGDNDWLSNTVDVIRLVQELPNKPNVHRVPYKKFNHIDFLWAMDAPKLVYKPLLNMLKNPV